MKAGAHKSMNMKPRHVRPVIASLAMLALTACGSLIDLGGGDPDALYELQPLQGGDDNRGDWILYIDEPTAPAALRTDRIAVRRGGRQIEFVSGARWVDRLTGLVGRYMVESLEGAQAGFVVGEETIELRGDYLLKLDVRDFSAFASGGSISSVTVRINATVLSTSPRSIVSQKQFSETVSAGGRSTAQVVEAFNEALNQTTIQITAFLEGLPPPEGP